MFIYGAPKQKVTMHRVSATEIFSSSRLNSLKHNVSRCRSSTGRLFHSRVPTTVKLLSPSRVCVRGTAEERSMAKYDEGFDHDRGYSPVSKRFTMESENVKFFSPKRK